MSELELPLAVGRAVALLVGRLRDGLGLGDSTSCCSPTT